MTPEVAVDLFRDALWLTTLMVAILVVPSLLVGLLVSNFVGGETKIERRIERIHAIDDPRFMHELGVLLGPPFLPGAQVRAYQRQAQRLAGT